MKLMFLVCFYTPSPKSFNKKPSKARDVIIRYAKRWNLKHDEIGSGYLFISPYVCRSVHMSVGPYEWCLSVRPNDVCRSVRKSDGPSVWCLSVRPFVHLSVPRSTRSFICLSILLSLAESYWSYMIVIRRNSEIQNHATF